MKIAAIQMSCGPDVERNVKRAIEMAKLAAEKGARLAAFQELSVYPWFPAKKDDGAFAMAQGLDGAIIAEMKELARETGMVLVCPIFERDGDSCYNSAVVIEKDSSVAGVYRKVHVPQVALWEEKYYFQPGNDAFPVFDTSCGRIGIQISWDNFFPEGSRILGLKGAQIVVAPTSAAFASQDRWLKVISANAITNGFFTLRANRVGREEHQSFYGASFCINPFGELVGEPAAERDTVYLVDIDLSLVDEAKRTLPFFQDRRPECYAEIVAATQ
ncbi:MAG: acyltransferase [Nitrospirota bacterium]|nr:acyltransferase [Nitrospirota bacterium]